MSQKAFFFHAKRCTGCKTCQLACADYHDLTKEFWYRRVYEVCDGNWEKDTQGCWSATTFAYYTSVACNHCTNPACTQVCPTGAMHKEADTGLVCVDETKCIGCGYCHMACPYNAPRVNREKGHSVKCNGCAERVAQGQMPICVEACPMHALDFGDVEEMSKLGARANFAPLPDASYTSPNLFAEEPAHALAAGDAKGKIKNTLEVM